MNKVILCVNAYNSSSVYLDDEAIYTESIYNRHM